MSMLIRFKYSFILLIALVGNIVSQEQFLTIKPEQILAISSTIQDGSDRTLTSFPPKRQLLEYKIPIFRNEGMETERVFFKEDFEGDTLSWRLEGSWELTFPNPGVLPIPADSRIASQNPGNNYIDHAFEELYSPLINIPPTTTVKQRVLLKVKNWFQLESYYDFGHLLVTDDNGLNWKQIGYVTGNSEGWIEMEYSISEYAGKNVHIAFLLTSDADENYAGWYIGNIEIDIVNGGSWRTDTGGDLDIYVGWNGNPGHPDMHPYTPPLDFNILVDESTLPFDDFTLILSAWDVDATYISGSEPGRCNQFPEVDNVYFNGHYVGRLTGSNNSWSISTFSVNKSWVNGGTIASPGVNVIEVYVDVLSRDQCDNWAVTVDWGVLDTANSQSNGVGFTTSYSDQGTDVNANGKFEYLDVTAAINVAQGNSGTFNLNGVLKTNSGLEMAWATNQVSLNSGITNVLLRFDGTEINSFGIDGPYFLRNTTIYQVSNPNINGWIVEAHTTQPYSYTDFEINPNPKPRVVQKIPPDGSTVPPTTLVKAVFSIDMLASTINASTFSLKKGTQSVSGTVSYDGTNKTATFIPASSLESGQQYQVTLSTGIRAQNGQYLPFVETWGFTIINDPELELLQQYAPILHFHNDDRFTEWLPTDVRIMTDESRLVYYPFYDIPDHEIQIVGRRVVDENPNLDHLIRPEPDRRHFLELKDPSSITGHGYDRVVYGRKTASVIDGRIVLQYWLFYPYNAHWGTLADDHEGDWEMIEVKLNEQGTDVDSVATGVHLFFTVLPKDRVQMTLTHPNVFVAKGSHASYLQPSCPFPNPANYLPSLAVGLILWYYAVPATLSAELVGAAGLAGHTITQAVAEKIIAHGLTQYAVAFTNELSGILEREDLGAVNGLIQWYNETFTGNLDIVSDDYVLPTYRKVKMDGSNQWEHWQGHWGTYPHDGAVWGWRQGPTGPLTKPEFKSPFNFTKFTIPFLFDNGFAIHFEPILSLRLGSPARLGVIDSSGNFAGDSLGQRIDHIGNTFFFAYGDTQYLNIYDLTSSKFNVTLDGKDNGGIYHLEVKLVERGQIKSFYFFSDRIEPMQRITIPFQIRRDSLGTYSLIPQHRTSPPLSQESVFSFPNPFNPDFQQANIRYSLGKDASVKIEVFDIANTLVKTVIDGIGQNANTDYAIQWDGRNTRGDIVGNGVYFYIISSSSGERAVGKIAVLR